MVDHKSNGYRDKRYDQPGLPKGLEVIQHNQDIIVSQANHNEGQRQATASARVLE